MFTQYLTHITNDGKSRPCNARTRACKYTPGTPSIPTLSRFKDYEEYKKASEEDRTLDYRSPAFFWDDDFKLDILSSMLHQRNCSLKGLQKDGRYVSNWQETSDPAWKKKHGTVHVDIANLSYDKLPEDWKNENYNAAKFILEEFVNKETIIHLSDNDARNEIGEKIHQAWLERNPAAQGGKLDIPFKELSYEEQEKDISQYRMALISFFGRLT